MHKLYCTCIAHLFCSLSCNHANIFPYADDLGPDDLCIVMETIYSVHPKWYNIGLKLHISFPTLDGIKANFKMTDECMREMLKQWLTQTSPYPSWRGLVEALSSVLVGEKRLAEQIHTQHCVPPHDVTDTETESTGMKYSNTFVIHHVTEHVKCTHMHVYNILVARYIHVHVFPAHLHVHSPEISGRAELIHLVMYMYCEA